jgi:hypothetical protein
MTRTPITRFLPGGIPTSWYQNGRIQSNAATEGHQLDGSVPLETLVEREPVRVEGTCQPRLAAEAGLHLLRLLAASGAANHREIVLEKFPLKAADDDPKCPFDADTRRFLQVTANRVPDGALLRSVFRGIADPGTIDKLPDGNNYRNRVKESVQSWQEWQQGLPHPDRTNVDNAIQVWLDWYDTLFNEPPPSDSTAWIPERLEYSALVAAPMPEGELVLTAPEYTDGDLDWFSFDILGAGSLGAGSRPPTKQEQITCSAIPVPVYFRGMPASRYWEFEDARIDFGAVTAGKQQLAHLLLIEFGLVSGDDWFVMPVVVPVGSLCHTDRLVVSDTFGECTLVPSARAVDENLLGNGDKLPWDMFRLSRDPRTVIGGGRSVPDVFFLPPTLDTSLHGPTLEEVMFLRDEMANMAWAVERIVEGPLGQPVNRSEAYFRSRPQKPAVPASGGATGEAPPLVYRLATDVPEHWIPLLPVRIRTDAPPINLHRGGVWRGRILEPSHDADGKPIPIHEEEVPREGAKVTRAFQYVRWTDGQTYLWVGRRKGVGRGEGSSGLRFDVLVPPDGADS